MANFHLLFTKEDEYFIHKTLGLICALHFIFRYTYVWYTTSTLGFSDETLVGITICNHVLVLFHFLLSFSSLIFHVIAKRLTKRPLIMYKEYQLHAIVFTLRACVIYIIGLPYVKSIVLYHFPNYNPYVGQGILLFFIHQLVDYITHTYSSCC